MKKIGLLLIAFITLMNKSFSQADTLPARAYALASIPIVKDSSRQRQQIMDGPTSRLSNLEVHLTFLDPGKAAHPPHTHTDTEELLNVKEGQLKVTIAGKEKILSPGGLALSLPGDEHGAMNPGKTKTVYYVIKYTKQPVDAARGLAAGGSILVDWSEPKPEKTDRGERRNFFLRPTALFERFDMHVTTLNTGQVSHLPHTHVQEEIIIIKSGNVKMQIGDKFYPARAGDIIFLPTGVPHALQNTGSESTTYFAFQWS